MTKNYYPPVLKALIWLVILLIAIGVIIITFRLLVSTNIAVAAVAPTVNLSGQAIQIGFNFRNRTPEYPWGDLGAPNHVFIHLYPMPIDGFITGVTYLNDEEPSGYPEVAEPITVLILRPVDRGWAVVHRITISDDESPPTLGEITTFELDSPLPVNKGDVFAHWQLKASAGTIPMNLERTSIDGLSSGDYGFSLADIEEGKFISGLFTGYRDYFINVIFEPAP
jgi:hypothetical protein